MMIDESAMHDWMILIKTYKHAMVIGLFWAWELVQI